MKRNWHKGLLALVLAVGLCLGGCTVEGPEDLASDGATQSSQISGEGSSAILEENADTSEQDGSQASDAASGSSQSDAASGGQTGSGNANGASGEKDQYQTDPVPEGKPKPQEPQDTVVDENTKLTCTLTIRCDTILDHMDQFNKDKLSVLPADGIIYSTRQVTLYEG